MPASGKATQPAHFAAFRCIGAECEDNCCAFWRVMVDKSAYDRFRSCSDPQLKPLLYENRSMLRILEKLGFRLIPSTDPETVEATMELG